MRRYVLASTYVRTVQLCDGAGCEVRGSCRSCPSSTTGYFAYMYMKLLDLHADVASVLIFYVESFIPVGIPTPDQ